MIALAPPSSDASRYSAAAAAPYSINELLGFQTQLDPNGNIAKQKLALGKTDCVWKMLHVCERHFLQTNNAIKQW